LETTLVEKLTPLADLDPVVEVRCGTGALAAVQLADPQTAMSFAKRLRSFGVATRAVGAGGIQVSPPLVMTDEQVGQMADAITAAITT
jgi:acetylornithine/succinyldiaminopimelate/putrescine aminotransferase